MKQILCSKSFIEIFVIARKEIVNYENKDIEEGLDQDHSIVT